MKLDLLGVAVRAASKERSSTIKRFQPCELTSWGDGASCWVIVWGVGARCCLGAWAMHGLDLSPHDEVLLRGPVPERALRVAASAVGGGTRVRIRRQDQPQRCGGSPVAEPTCEEFADVAREQVGRLGRREVAAARHRRPAADVV
jgi:hypothetical protein